MSDCRSSISIPQSLSAQRLPSWLTTLQAFKVLERQGTERDHLLQNTVSGGLQAILRELLHVCSALEGDLQRERVDRWCLDVAKSGLQERVAAQAAAVVELEGLTEKLSLQCSDKAQTVQVDLAFAPHTTAWHVP